MRSRRRSPWDTTAPETIATPAGGVVRPGQTVTLSANETATIYYTLDGSVPDTTSAIYSAPLPLFADTVIHFFGRDLTGNTEPAVRSATYRVAQPGDLDLSGVVDIADAVAGPCKRLPAKHRQCQFIRKRM